MQSFLQKEWDMVDYGFYGCGLADLSGWCRSCCDACMSLTFVRGSKSLFGLDIKGMYAFCRVLGCRTTAEVVVDFHIGVVPLCGGIWVKRSNGAFSKKAPFTTREMCMDHIGNIGASLYMDYFETLPILRKPVAKGVVQVSQVLANFEGKERGIASICRVFLVLEALQRHPRSICPGTQTP